MSVVLKVYVKVALEKLESEITENTRVHRAIDAREQFFGGRTLCPLVYSALFANTHYLWH